MVDPFYYNFILRLGDEHICWPYSGVKLRYKWTLTNGKWFFIVVNSELSNQNPNPLPDLDDCWENPGTFSRIIQEVWCGRMNHEVSILISEENSSWLMRSCCETMTNELSFCFFFTNLITGCFDTFNTKLKTVRSSDSSMWHYSLLKGSALHRLSLCCHGNFHCQQWDGACGQV